MRDATNLCEFDEFYKAKTRRSRFPGLTQVKCLLSPSRLYGNLIVEFFWGWFPFRVVASLDLFIIQSLASGVYNVFAAAVAYLKTRTVTRTT